MTGHPQAPNLADLAGEVAHLREGFATLTRNDGAHAAGIEKLSSAIEKGLADLSVKFLEALMKQDEARRESDTEFRQALAEQRATFEASLATQRAAHRDMMDKLVEIAMRQLAGMVVRPIASKAWDYLVVALGLGGLAFTLKKLGMQLPGWMTR